MLPGRTARGTERRSIWSFVLGAVCGVVLCLAAVYWVTAPRLPHSVQVPPAVAEIPRAPEPPILIDIPAPTPAIEAPRPVMVKAIAAAPKPVLAPAPTPAAAPRRDAPRAAVAPPRREPAAPFIGTLRIDSTPQGARVLVDRQAVGVTPLRMTNVTAGSHVVRVEADGHVPWSSAIRVVADRQTDVRTTLTPSADAP